MREVISSQGTVSEPAREVDAREPDSDSQRRPFLARLRSVAQTLEPFRGIKNDVRNRLPHYKTDWKDGWSPGIK